MFIIPIILNSSSKPSSYIFEANEAEVDCKDVRSILSFIREKVKLQSYIYEVIVIKNNYTHRYDCWDQLNPTS